MQLVKHQLPTNAEIVLTSDWHIGSSLQHSKGVQQVIDYIMAKRNRYMIHGGDIVESIAIDDKRFQMSTVEPGMDMPLAQYQAAIDTLAPVAKAKKLLGIHDGNHDERWLTKYGNCIRDIVCKALGVFYATYSAKYIINGKDNKPKYKIFITHGNGAINSHAKDPIQRDANMAANLKMKLQYLAGDCQVMAMGHTHKLIVVEPKHELVLLDDGTQIKQEYVTNPDSTRYIHPDHRWYTNTGSMLKLYGDMGVSGYAEKAMYKPVELGYCIIETDDYKITNVKKVVV